MYGWGVVRCFLKSDVMYDLLPLMGLRTSNWSGSDRNWTARIGLHEKKRNLVSSPECLTCQPVPDSSKKFADSFAESFSLGFRNVFLRQTWHTQKSKSKVKGRKVKSNIAKRPKNHHSRETKSQGRGFSTNSRCSCIFNNKKLNRPNRYK